jgi:seryl-tRNA synthetase
MGEFLKMKKYLPILVCASFFVGCSNTSTQSVSVAKDPLKESKILKVKNRDIYNEMLHINDRLVNSDKRIKILNEKVNVLTKRKDKTVEIEGKIQEHEKVLMALMNDVVDLSKGQKNLQKSNRILHNEIEEVKIKLEAFTPTTFELTRKSNIRNAPWKDIVKVWDKGKRFTAYNNSGDWIKISGIFIDGKWTAVNDELWTHNSNTRKFR